MRSIALSLSLSLALACNEAPRVASAEAALEVLRRSLATGQPSLEESTAARVTDDMEFVRRSADAFVLAEHDPLRADFESLLRAARQQHDADARFRPHAAMLEGGRCSKLADVSLPFEWAPLPAATERWPAALRAVREQTAAQIARARAGRFRCALGRAFIAVYLPGASSTALPRIAAIYPDLLRAIAAKNHGVLSPLC